MVRETMEMNSAPMFMFAQRLKPTASILFITTHQLCPFIPIRIDEK